MTNTAPPPAILIAFVASAAVMGTSLVTPALPLIQGDLNASADTVQLVLTLFFLSLAFSQLVVGTISDRFGRRPVLLTGTLLFALSGGASALVNSIEVLNVLRVLQGIGAAACMAMARAIVNDSFPRTEAARAQALIQTFMAVVPFASLSAGGFIALWIGWQGTMAVMGVGGLLGFLVTALLISETNRERLSSIKPSAVFGAYADVLKRRQFRLLGTTAMAQAGAFFGLLGFIPYQYAQMGYTPAEFGLYFSLTPLSYIVGNTLNRLYVLNWGLERAIALGSFGTLVAVIALYITQAMEVPGAIGLVLPCMLFGLSNGITVANSTVGSISAAGPNRGTAAGLVGASQMGLGGLVGSTAIALGAAENFLIGVTLMLGLMVLSTSCAWLVLRESVAESSAR